MFTCITKQIRKKYLFANRLFEHFPRLPLNKQIVLPQSHTIVQANVAVSAVLYMLKQTKKCFVSTTKSLFSLIQCILKLEQEEVF